MRKIKDIFSDFRKKRKETEFKSKPIHSFKDGVAVVFLSFLCLFAILQELEILAIVILLLIGAIIYKGVVIEFLKIGRVFLRSTRLARLGDFEIESYRDRLDKFPHFSKLEGWAQIVLSQLDDKKIALLLSINKQDKFEVKRWHLERLESLGRRGLIAHDGEVLQTAKTVWLSDLGREIVSMLISVSDK